MSLGNNERMGTADAVDTEIRNAIDDYVASRTKLIEIAEAHPDRFGACEDVIGLRQ